MQLGGRTPGHHGGFGPARWTIALGSTPLRWGSLGPGAHSGALFLLGPDLWVAILTGEGCAFSARYGLRHQAQAGAPEVAPTGFRPSASIRSTHL